MNAEQANFSWLKAGRDAFFHGLLTSIPLMLLVVLGAGCRSNSLTMPPQDEIGEIGRAMDLPLTIESPPNFHIRDSIVMNLKVFNVTNHPVDYFVFEYLDPETTFEIWLLHDGRQVPLSKSGESKQLRHKVGLMTLDGPSDQIPPAGTKTMPICISDLFKVTEPGKYTVVVEQGPIFDNDDPHRRSLFAAKASFNMLPQLTN